MKLSINSRVPDFTLPNSAGESVNLAAVAAEHRVVLVYYRGAW